MRRAAVALLVCSAQLAFAGPHTVLVLHSEGTADATTRANIDAQVLRLAKSVDGKVDAGDITLTEAAAVVGCKIADASCKDEVLTTLGVDELVGTTVTTSPTGTNVTVRRYTKGSAPRGAQTTIPNGKTADAKMTADIGPLFGAATTTAPAPAEPPPAAPPPAAVDTSTEPMTNNTAVSTPPATPPPAEGSGSHPWPKVGIGVGAGFMVIGVIMWTQAADTQSQIDKAPASSPADFRHIKSLESQGDNFATAGNVFFVVGTVVAGVSGFLLWRAHRHASTQTARLAPALFPHGGAGLTLTFGGER